jgi:GNAT superfamily N-acetyltransferase
MPITYRRARLEDLERADALVVATINDLTERHGFGRMANASPPRFQSFCMDADPRGLWMAEEDGDPLGFAWSWVRDEFWFLAQLFVQPGVQAKGVGRELLRRAIEHADQAGAKQRALITFAFNTVSQGLYIRHGFAPQFPIYSMGAPRSRITARSPSGSIDVRPLDGSAGEAAALSEVDRLALGFARDEHHGVLASEPGTRGFGLHEEGCLVGSFYVSEGGHIGPIAVASPDHMQAAFSTALAVASRGQSPSVSCFVPGSNSGVLRNAMDVGMRIRFPMLMMSTGDLAGWPRYLPRNPGFM